LFISLPSYLLNCDTNNLFDCNDLQPLPGSFCKKVGFTETCKITLKSSEKKGSWEVHGLVYEKICQWKLSGGWKMFCRDNGLKEGDVCTFKVLKSKLWHVDIDRC
jgi:hypothetical protein